MLYQFTGEQGTIGGHTDAWRQLSHHLGDDLADWACQWADAQDNPQEAVEALITVGDLAYDRWLRDGNRARVREVMLQFIVRSMLDGAGL